MYEDNQETIEKNKAVVLRFNKEVIEGGSEDVFWELMAPEFVNRTAAEGMSAGPDGMIYTFNQVLRPAFPDLKVEIYDQFAEGDKVTTRKALKGTQLGALMGIPPTKKNVTIDVIDIVRVRGGRYVEHWGMNNLAAVLAQLRGS